MAEHIEIINDPGDWSFHVTPWEETFLQRVHSATRIIRIACPFIKLRNVRLILASLKTNDEVPLRIDVLTRLNVRDCRSFVHDISAIKLLLAAPLGGRCDINVRVNNRLHAKLYVFDDTEVFVTSSNLTFAGFNRNLEIALGSTRQAVVSETVDHFETLFRDGRLLTHEFLSEFEVKLRSSLPATKELPEAPAETSEATDEKMLPVAIEGPEPPTETTEARDESSLPVENELAEAPTETIGVSDPLVDLLLDEDAIKQIDSALETQLDDGLVEEFVSLSSRVGDHLESSELVEQRFYEDMNPRFRILFGQPTPDENDLASIYFHSSAYQDARVGRPDSDDATVLKLIGKLAFESHVCLDVCRSASTLSFGESVHTKVEHICLSDHLLRQMHSVGIARMIGGKSLAVGDTATERGVNKSFREMMYRFVGYLYRTRDWPRFRAAMSNLVQLEEEFPFETYREDNVKGGLQKVTQEKYDAYPRYEIVEESGPDHDRTYRVVVYGGKNSKKVLGDGEAATIQAAEVRAASSALLALSAAAPVSSWKEGHDSLPVWLEKKCDTEGRRIVKKLVGKDLSIKSCRAVLVPYSGGLMHHRTLRSRLAAVGGNIRRLLAATIVADELPKRDEVVRYGQRMNSNDKVVERVLQSPLGQWLKELASNKLFHNSAQPGPVIDSVNALIGAVCIEQGDVEACRQLCKIIFVPIGDLDERTSARARLQKKVQSVVRNRCDDLLKVETTCLSESSGSHNAEFEAIVLLDGQEVGRASAGRKKRAAEMASEKAVENPTLNEVLERLANANVP